VQYKHEALRDDNRTGDGQRLAAAGATFHNLGAFIQDEWSLRDNVDLVLGARVDKGPELDNAVFSPRIALAWQATPNLKWRAGIATGFRAPRSSSRTCTSIPSAANRCACATPTA
jgi:outer membrane receptor for ferrienterochelin and colicins